MLAAHVGTIVTLTLHTPCLTETHYPPETPVSLVRLIVSERSSPATEPIPEIVFTRPTRDLNALQLVEFVDDEWGDISQVVASSSAPQLSRLQAVDAAMFAQHAGLPAGQTASVVLTVQVLPDGTAGTIEVARSSGVPEADAAAIAYARRLHWIPGTRDHHAESMRVSLPVTLVWNP